MSDAFIGEIRAFGFNLAPLDWAFCNGQILPIAQYSALYAILGTTYGGNGQTNFALPNLQCQVPMHWGTGSDSTTVIGEVQGTPQVTLLITEIPAHAHTISVANLLGGSASERSPGPKPNSYISQSAATSIYQVAPVTTNTPFNSTAISVTGGSLPHENRQPYLTVNFCISLSGQFPSRN